MQVLSALAKFNAQRGVISWLFCQDGDDYVAIRNDGRRYPYPSREAMREGYKKLLKWSFVRIK